MELPNKTPSNQNKGRKAPKQVAYTDPKCWKAMTKLTRALVLLLTMVSPEAAAVYIALKWNTAIKRPPRLSKTQLAILKVHDAATVLAEELAKRQKRSQQVAKNLSARAIVNHGAGAKKIMLMKATEGMSRLQKADKIEANGAAAAIQAEQMQSPNLNNVCEPGLVPQPRERSTSGMIASLLPRLEASSSPSAKAAVPPLKEHLAELDEKKRAETNHIKKPASGDHKPNKDAA